MRVLQLLAGFAVATSVLLSCATAGLASDRPWVEAVQRLILKEAEILAELGFEPATRAMIEMTGRRDVRRFVLRLEQGETYAMIAACDQDCDHASLQIFDDQRQLMTGTTRQAGVVLLTGKPDQTGHYEVELTQPGCTQRHCHTGFVVMQQGGRRTQDLIVAASKGQRIGPAVAGVSYGMERRPGVEIQAGNYLEYRNISLVDCERRCLADRQCRALEYYRERQSCGLFNSVPVMQRARGIDVSIKTTLTE